MSETADKLKALLKDVENSETEEKVNLFNELSDVLYKFVDMNHPALNVKLVKGDTVVGNDYNPNKVAPPEMKLLKLSIRKDGVTMPVVGCRDEEGGGHVVVDGFHRTTVIKESKDINESLHGYIPMVELNKSIQDRITSTVRHNMARGTHQVELSAKLVTALKKHNWTNQRIGMELGMDPDEVLRLKQVTGLAEAFANEDFSKSWN